MQICRGCRRSLGESNNSKAAASCRTPRYLANSPLIGQIIVKQLSTVRLTTTKQYDNLNQLRAALSPKGIASCGPSPFAANSIGSARLLPTLSSHLGLASLKLVQPRRAAKAPPAHTPVAAPKTVDSSYPISIPAPRFLKGILQSAQTALRSTHAGVPSRLGASPYPGLASRKFPQPCKRLNAFLVSSCKAARRISKEVWNRTTATDRTPDTYNRFIYDGWNLLAEVGSSATLPELSPLTVAQAHLNWYVSHVFRLKSGSATHSAGTPEGPQRTMILLVQILIVSTTLSISSIL